MSTVRGRVVDVAAGRVLIQHEGGVSEVNVAAGVQPGDLVIVADDQLSVIAAHPGAGGGFPRTLHPRRVRAMAVRDRVEQGIRDFFRAQAFREVRTPILVPCPGLEPHLKPFEVAGAGFLHTSPEFAMKRLLCGGLERIFQLATVFRDEPDAPTHRREFTMLEWYRAWAGAEAIMQDVEALFAELAIAQLGAPTLIFRGRAISVAPPWPRLRVRDLFAEHAGVDLTADDLGAACARLGIRAHDSDSWDDLYFRIWLEAIEPKLPADRAVFVTRYPASQAALAVIDADPDGSRWARRFEVYAGGLELGNAFEELTDPVEQRRRFVKDLELRARTYGDAFPTVPLPEDFLAALEDGMPPAGGIAMGVDRIAMLFADEPDIGYLSWL